MLLTSTEDGPVLQKGQEKSIRLTFRVSPEKQANEPKPLRLPIRVQTPASLQEGCGVVSVLHRGAISTRSCVLGEGRTPVTKEQEPCSLCRNSSWGVTSPLGCRGPLRKSVLPLPADDHAASRSHHLELEVTFLVSTLLQRESTSNLTNN